MLMIYVLRSNYAWLIWFVIS